MEIKSKDYMSGKYDDEICDYYFKHGICEADCERCFINAWIDVKNKVY